MSDESFPPEPAVEPSAAPVDAASTPSVPESRPESRPEPRTREQRPVSADFVRNLAEKTARLVAKDVARDVARQAAREAIREAIGSGGGGSQAPRQDAPRSNKPGELVNLLRDAIAEAMRRDRDWEEELADAIGATPDDLKGFIDGDEPDAETTLMLVQELARWQAENETQEEESFGEASDSDDVPDAEAAEQVESAVEQPDEAPVEESGGDEITPPDGDDEDSRPVPIPVD